MKQDCILNPLLFPLFVNNISYYLDGEISVNDVNNKLLAFAGDIVSNATVKLALQNIIKSSEQYCRKSNLVVNLNKSRILVFRNGGRRCV